MVEKEVYVFGTTIFVSKRWWRFFANSLDVDRVEVIAYRWVGRQTEEEMRQTALLFVLALIKLELFRASFSSDIATNLLISRTFTTNKQVEDDEICIK